MKNRIIHTLAKKLKPLLRAVRLLWGRLGSARPYVAVTVAVLLVLAGIGAGQIVLIWQGSHPNAVAIDPTSTKSEAGPSIAKTASPTEGINKGVADWSPQPQPASPIPTEPPPQPPDANPDIVITDIKQRKKRGRRGETLITATIGLAARSAVEKGDVEIRISFFDLTPNNEVRPTDAQVTYQWLTPVRDWSDPAPKYLEATYLKWPTRYTWVRRLRYGGVVVRLYAHGKLQAERSDPKELISLLGSNQPEEPDEDRDADVPAAPQVDRSPIHEQKTTPAKPTNLPSASPPPKEKKNNASPALPFGKAVPGKPGFVSSPYDPKFIIDVRGFPPGTLVNDPNTNKPFRVP